MIQWSYIHNDFIEEADARLPVRDLSILRGYAVFDFLRFENFQPVYLNDHLDRLLQSAGFLKIAPEITKPALEKIIRELIQKNNIPCGGIRISVTGGRSEDGYAPSTPTLLITQHKFQETTKENFEKGISLITYPYQRQLPHIKSIDYLMGIYLLPEIRQAAADDVLYYHQNIITECPRANIFIVSNDELLTPAHHILEGITRKKIIQLASPYFEVKETDITLEDLYHASEIFITSTTKKILPVSSVNGKKIGHGGKKVASTVSELYHQNYASFNK